MRSQRLGATALVAAGAVLSALVMLTEPRRDALAAAHGGGGASRGARLHSVGYYENLAAADQWEAGPTAGTELADAHVRRGRTQLLAQVRTQRLGSRGHALVGLCAQGNDRACAQIANSPRELRSLQAAQQRAQEKLRQLAPAPDAQEQQQMMDGVKRAARAMANQVQMLSPKLAAKACSTHARASLPPRHC
jgi:hypothetical protein